MSDPGRRRVRDAIGRRLGGPYAALGRIEERLEALSQRLDRLEQREGILRDDIRGALLALAAEEAENRSRLRAARQHPDYGAAWEESRPLISVTVATIGRPELIDRSLASILAQSYAELEVIVVGDDAGPETARQVESLGDSRVRYRELGPRQQWTDEPGRLWLAAATRARNAALDMARGRWLVEFDDDDAMRPGCLESLLKLARESRAEAVYGRILMHEDGAQREIGRFPPRQGEFSWAAGMYHGGLRFFERQSLAADLGLPGDWWLAERMLRAGVRFAIRDEVLSDVHGSGRKQAALQHGRLPWA